MNKKIELDNYYGWNKKVVDTFLNNRKAVDEDHDVRKIDDEPKKKKRTKGKSKEIMQMVNAKSRENLKEK